MALGSKKKHKGTFETDRIEQLMNERAERLPVVLVVDCSGSMAGCIDELNEGIRTFYEACQKHERASNSVEVAVVSFGDHATLSTTFCSVHSATPPELEANLGCTNFTEAVQLGLDTLSEVKAVYRASGNKSYKPWFVFMSDGGHNSGPAFEPLAELVSDREVKKDLIVFPIAIGSGADLNQLKKFSKKRGVMKINGHNFAEFFEWLSASATKTSESSAGDRLDLPDPTQPSANGKTWCEIES